MPRIFSQQQVIIPRIAEIHIQKTAPGPPAHKAVATPAMLPVPRQAARAEVSAANCETEPSVLGAIAYDLTYCTELAMGVYQLYKEGKTGCMVYVDSYGNVSPLYLADLQDPETGKIPPRIVDINSGTAQNYYEYIAHYVTEDDYEAVRALGIENPEAYDFKKILEW